jgi:hypothetical protein
MLRIFFLSAVWLLLLATGVQMIDYFLRAHEIFRSHMPGFSARILLGPLVIFSGELMLWLGLFRDENPGARIMAALVGIFALVLLLVMALSVDLWQLAYPRYLYWLYLYVAAGHLAYAMFGRERKW